MLDYDPRAFILYAILPLILFATGVVSERRPVPRAGYAAGAALALVMTIYLGWLWF